MGWIINIETATEVCSVAVARAGEVVAIKESHEPNVHSARTAQYIIDTIEEAGIGMKDLSAVAVSKGPGSYTGLRIGVSSAKGLCYALDIPLISVGTLEAMTYGARVTGDKPVVPANALFCPMIDARRMEVYNELFDRDGTLVRETLAEVIDENSFHDLLRDHIIYFFGNGSDKGRELLSKHQNARFLKNIYPSSRWLAHLSYKKYTSSQFEDLAYFEPFYLKDFVAKVPKVRGLF